MEKEYCVYWHDFDEVYYVSEDKGDSTLDSVCFRGTLEECNEYADKKNESLFDNASFDDFEKLLIAAPIAAIIGLFITILQWIII